jgi:protein O-GlcNAcase/histone acetyltransferase
LIIVSCLRSKDFSITYVCALDESVSADIKLETEAEDGISEDIPSTLPENVYHPRRALKNAILDWLAEFKRHKQAWGPISKPQPLVTMAIPIPVPIIPSINTCMSLTTTTQATTTVSSVVASSGIVNEVNENTVSQVMSTTENGGQLQALANACNTVNSVSFCDCTLFTITLSCNS